MDDGLVADEVAADTEEAARQLLDATLRGNRAQQPSRLCSAQERIHGEREVRGGVGCDEVALEGLVQLLRGVIGRERPCDERSQADTRDAIEAKA